jgi:hypothetical protein
LLGGGHVFVLGGIDFASFYDFAIWLWTTGVTSGAGTTHPSGALEFTPGFLNYF